MTTIKVGQSFKGVQIEVEPVIAINGVINSYSIKNITPDKIPYSINIDGGNVRYKTLDSGQVVKENIEYSLKEVVIMSCIDTLRII